MRRGRKSAYRTASPARRVVPNARRTIDFRVCCPRDRAPSRNTTPLPDSAVPRPVVELGSRIRAAPSIHDQRVSSFQPSIHESIPGSRSFNRDIGFERNLARKKADWTLAWHPEERKRERRSRGRGILRRLDRGGRFFTALSLLQG